MKIIILYDILFSELNSLILKQEGIAMLKKVFSGMLCAFLILSFICMPFACTRPGEENATPDPTEANTTGTDEPGDPEETDDPSPKPGPDAQEVLPESLSAQAIETDCAVYRFSVQQSGRIVSSYIPSMIDEEDEKIRETMETDFYGDSEWVKSSLEFTLRLGNSLCSVLNNAADWYSPGSALVTAWGAETPSWTANGRLSENKVGSINRKIDDRFRTAIRLTDADASFNAHSYAWSGGMTDCGWLEDPLPLMLDAAVETVDTPQPGDIVVYLAPSEDGGDIAVHSAIVRETEGEIIVVESKLGQCGVYRHAINDVPNEYYYSERDDDGVLAGVIRYLIFRAPGMDPEKREVCYPDGFGGFADNADGSDVLPEVFADSMRSIKPRHLLGSTKKEEQGILASLTDSMPAEALSEEELITLEEWMGKYYPFCFLKDHATSEYNGHSYAWSGGKKDQGWLISPAALWEREDVRLAEDIQQGDVIVYVNCGEDGLWHAVHSAIVREVVGDTVLVESKFGSGGLYMHELSDIPGDWQSEVNVKRSNGKLESWYEVYYVAFRLP